MAAPWHLHVIGECTLVGSSGTPTSLSAKSKRFAVLVFLALPAPGRRIRRDVLLAAFWPELDTAHARNALRVTLHQLRQTLGADTILGAGEEELWVDPAAMHVDLADLDAALASGDALPWLARPSLELVPGLHVSDAAPFEEWLDDQRRLLTARVVRGAWAIVGEAERAGDRGRAIVAARAATRLARDDEAGLRRLVSLLDAHGDRAGALAEVELFEAWLREHYDAEPSPETRSLVRRVRSRTMSSAITEPHDETPVAHRVPADLAGTGEAITTSRAEAPPPPKRRRHRVVFASVIALVCLGGSAAVLRSSVTSPRRPDAVHVPVPEARQLARDAEWLLGRRSRDELLRSRALYTRALEIDPAWSDLWLGLARVTGGLAYRHYTEYRPGLAASEHAADEALARAPDDARAMIERGLARFQLGNRAGAEQDIRRAASLDSTDAHMQSLIGTWWQWSGPHLDSALLYTRRAQRLRPWDRQFAINALQIVACLPDSLATIREAQHVLDMDANEPEALETMAWTLTRLGRWDEAAQFLARRYARYATPALVAHVSTLSGEERFTALVRALRGAQLQDLRANPPGTPLLLESRIALFEDLGMRDSSLAALASVVDSLDAHHANMMCGPGLRAFRHDPRTQAIVRARGWTPAEFARAP